MVHYFICEKCDLAFSLRLGLEHVCPGCRSKFIRKRRNRDLVEDSKYTGIVAGQPEGDREYTRPDPADETNQIGAPSQPTPRFEMTAGRPTGFSERRRILRVPYRHVLRSLLFGQAGLPDVIVVIRGHGLPEDVEVLSVHENHWARTFDFVLAHPSFDPVPEMELAPVVPPLGLYHEVISLRPLTPNGHRL